METGMAVWRGRPPIGVFGGAKASAGRREMVVPSAKGEPAASVWKAIASKETPLLTDLGSDGGASTPPPADERRFLKAERRPLGTLASTASLTSMMAGVPTSAGVTT